MVPYPAARLLSCPRSPGGPGGCPPGNNMRGTPCPAARTPMTDETEIRLTAERFVERFGKDAPRQATMRANELRAAGHIEEYDIWMSIFTEVKSLLDEGRKKR